MDSFKSLEKSQFEWMGTEPVPTAPYCDERYFTLEREAIFRRTWLKSGASRTYRYPAISSCVRSQSAMLRFLSCAVVTTACERFTTFARTEAPSLCGRKRAGLQRLDAGTIDGRTPWMAAYPVSRMKRTSTSSTEMPAD